MFKIDRSENRIQKLESRTFASLSFREREHLQEWIANEPSALGEDLLIIQKEFDGFDETRERLDLLAIDKEGSLVIIENKLDDTGRDVVWQALKYVAYCSSLTKSQIVSIFQKYLDQYDRGKQAAEVLCDFLEVEDLDEAVLNAGTSQRFLLVAANFRKEVTATVLWLLSNGIRAQCIKVTPFQFGQELLLDVSQIIPTPEAEEYMIGMSTKESEETALKGAKKTRHILRNDFWEMLLEAFKERGITTYQNISPSSDHWLSAGSGVSGCPYTLIFSRKEARVQLSIGQTGRDRNKAIFDYLEGRKQEIETVFGGPLVWRRLNEKKQCRVACAQDFDGFNRDSWPEMIDWLAEHFVKFEAAFKGPLAQLPK